MQLPQMNVAPAAGDESNGAAVSVFLGSSVRACTGPLFDMGDCVPDGHRDRGRAKATELASVAKWSINRQRALEYGNSERKKKKFEACGAS